MSDRILNQLLGSDDPRDPGCEACFALLDRYADAVLDGRPAAELFPEVAAHLLDCAACREDTEGLLAALRAVKNSGDDR